MSDPLKGLQAILGTDKKNPMFAVYRDVQKRELHVYYGFELLEVVPDDKNSPHFRLMVAQLYNGTMRCCGGDGSPDRKGAMEARNPVCLLAPVATWARTVLSVH